MPIQTEFISSTSTRAASTFTLKESLNRYPSFSVISVVIDKTPTPFLLVDVTAPTVATADSFVQTAHGMITGLKVQVVANASSTLPTGLAPATDYFVIRITANTFKLGSTQSLAISGTPIDITAFGTGTMTVTPAALNASFVLQASNDGGSWADIPGSLFAIPAVTSAFFEKEDAQYAFLRARLVVNAGQLCVSSVFNSHL